MPDATQNLKLKITADSSEARSSLGGIHGLAGAIAGVTAALYAAKTAYKNFIEPVIQYNKEIKDASDSTGMAVEELSRFVQVGDDMGVTMGAITKALEMGTKNGFAPSIDALADLADKGNAMSSTTERAAFYTKIFGRNWAELNPILQLGGQRIRDMAEAQADGLVVTDEEILKTEELRVGLDELNDNWIGIRNNLVLSVTPALIQVTEKQNFWQAALKLLNPEVDDLSKNIDDVSDSLNTIPVPPPVEVDLVLTINGQQVSIERWLGMLNRGVNRRFYSDVTGGSVIPSALSTTAYPGIGSTGSSGGGVQEGYALGGEVGTGGNAYMVGEHGAERFTPKVPGTISPSRDQLATSIDRMVKALPTILIDAIERAK